MKYVKFCSLGILLFLATISAQFAIAMPVTVAPTASTHQLSIFVPDEDDYPDEPDDGSDQCRLAFPFCEAF